MNFAHPRAVANSTAAALLLLGWAAAGCTSTQHNDWYFAAAELPTADDLSPTTTMPTTQPSEAAAAERDGASAALVAATQPATQPSIRLKFYRLRITAWSINGKAELLTGLYPAAALHDLFGEVKRPDEDNPADTSGAAAAGHDHTGDGAATTRALRGAEAGETGGVPSVASDGSQIECDRELGRLKLVPPGSRFTIFYGVNAQAIADQVKQFATAETTGNQLGSLLLAASGAGEAKLRADAAEGTATDLQKGASTAAAELKTQAAKIAMGTAKEDVRKAYVAAAQAALKALGSNTTLSDKDDTWTAQATSATNAIRGKGENP